MVSNPKKGLDFAQSQSMYITLQIKLITTVRSQLVQAKSLQIIWTL